MRVSSGNGSLRVKAIAGTHVVLMAMDMAEDGRKGLRGFAIKRSKNGQPASWLKGIKYFKGSVDAPTKGEEFASNQQPFQTFLWSDYAAAPDTEYEFTIVPLYGAPGSFEHRGDVSFKIHTEKENANGHGIWFNRGAIASHKLSQEFQNKKLTDAMVNDVDDQGRILDKEVAWLSRGLAEACLAYINGTKAGEGLRVCAYEFTWKPIVRALKRALDRGVDVRIIYHAVPANQKIVDATGLKINAIIDGKKTQVLFKRTRPPIPHNKFIVKLKGGKAKQVWTGSTNFTDTGFFGQTNVGHLVTHNDTATTYLKYWQALSENPTHVPALKNATTLTPNPSTAIAPGSIVEFFSPRVFDNMLDWYGQRIKDACALTMMTIPFNVAAPIFNALDTAKKPLRLVILENDQTKDILDSEKRNKGKLLYSNGAILGKTFIHYAKNGAGVAPIANSNIERWFIDEELARPVNTGHVFFVHSKILLIDPLSTDPLICSGSANFSKGSLITNDENMLLIRGDMRVADIYLTEFDRIFRHFYARDVINKLAADGKQEDWLFLDDTSGWITANYKAGTYKNNRMKLFFPDAAAPGSWAKNAASDPDPFADEDARAAADRKRKNDNAKARRAGNDAPVKKAATKKVSAKKTVAKKPAAKKAARKR